MRRLAKAKPQREPTIALINIVFLMLVFFMVAGTLARPVDPTLELVETRTLDGVSPPDALVVYPDGRISHGGQAFVASLTDAERAVIRLLPDRSLPAEKLVTLTRTLRAAGAGQVVLVTKRGLE